MKPSVTKPDRVIRTKKFPRISSSAPYAATAVRLRQMLIEVWGGSQSTMAEATGLDLGLVYRMISGERPPTPKSLGAIIGTLSRKHKQDALELLTLYLQDVADEAHHGFHVNVEAAV